MSRGNAEFSNENISFRSCFAADSYEDLGPNILSHYTDDKLIYSYLESFMRISMSLEYRFRKRLFLENTVQNLGGPLTYLRLTPFQQN